MTLSLFLYGTLMHPKVFQRVIRNDGSHLKMCPAVLFDYTRHKSKGAAYPGMIPYEKSRILCNRELDREERSVRGVVVTGLTKKDFEFLDIFEGAEYTRSTIEVYLLGPMRKSTEYQTGDKSLIPSSASILPAPAELTMPFKTETYVFNDVGSLEPELWSFEEFAKNSAAQWYAEQGEEDVRWTEAINRSKLNE